MEMAFYGSSRKWSDSTWTHGKQLEQLLQQVTTRGHIASSRPMLTKGCCKGNNYEQRFTLDTFPADFSWRNVLAKPGILLFYLAAGLQYACRLLLVVKVVFVVFPNSGGRIANSTNPITRFSGWTPFMWFTFKTSYCSSPKHIEKQWHFAYSFPKTDTNDKNRECTLCVGLALWECAWLQHMAQHRANHRNTIRLW